VAEPAIEGKVKSKDVDRHSEGDSNPVSEGDVSGRSEGVGEQP